MSERLHQTSNIFISILYIYKTLKINHNDTVPPLRIPLINFLPKTSSALFLEEKRLTQTVKSSASTKADQKSPISVRGEGEDPEKWTTSNLRPTS